MKNIRYNIDPDLVSGAVFRAIYNIEVRRARTLAETKESIEQYKTRQNEFAHPFTNESLEWINPHFDACIKRERNKYSKVRVIKIARSKYVLAYGNTKNSLIKRGTGPFKTLREAQNWFINGGR